MAPVYFALRESNAFDTVFLATAQHRQMLDQTLGVFGIVPEHDLNLMQPGQTLPDLTGRVLTAVSHWCNQHNPAAILVQGDTTTVLASAMAAFYAKIPVGHVEAGLRTGNMMSPFPEEMNRRLTSPITRWHFCPTEVSQANLQREGISTGLHVTGNTVVDALLWVRNRLQANQVSAIDVAGRLNIPSNFRREFLEGSKRWILVTGHRRESFGDGFERICQSIIKLTATFPDVGVLFPVHLNPQVREPVQRLLGSNDRVALVEPAGYEDFVWLMDHCTFLLSDSGGVQEEAPSLGKPVLVMRDTTERPEGIEAGTCRLVGTHVETIVREASLLLNDHAEYAKRSALKNPYGDGLAAPRIRAILEKEL
jgi:UDP-N-acetylglucosamine 2-epimerase (non-hydrolysing)